MKIHPLYLLIALVLLFSIDLSFGQSGHTYRKYKRNVCLPASGAYKSIPGHVYFTIRPYNNILYVIYNDQEWFENIFRYNLNSLGAKLVSADYYDCQTDNKKVSDNYFYYMKPRFYFQMKDKAEKSDNLYFLPLWNVPDSFVNKDFDISIIISRWGRKCLNVSYRLIPIHDWQLLEPVLLADTLLFESEEIKIQDVTDPIKTSGIKTLDIIFPKDNVSYNKDELHDFLKALPLDKYKPVKVNIQGYASVEGTKERNRELYNKRAEVIIDEMKKILPDTIEYETEVSENWDDFFSDIRDTPYEYLADKSSDEIKEKLFDEEINSEMEPILKNHRKTIAQITLQKSIHPKKSTINNLMDFYVTALENEHMESVLQIQDAIFQNIQGENVVAEFPKDLPLPENKPFSFALNRDYLHRYKVGITSTEQTYELYRELAGHYPDNPYIRFNLAEMMFRLWLQDNSQITDRMMRNTINSMNNYDIPFEASRRLKVNYHKIMVNRNYYSKPKKPIGWHIRQIRNVYSKTDLDERDMISIAKFLRAYNQINVAERILRPYARKEKPDEDLLFYYIKLTITKTRIIRTQWYRDLMVQAYLQNPARFCNLFLPHSKPEGHGMLVLNNENIKEIYCKLCIIKD